MKTATTAVSTHREPELLGQTLVLIGGSARIGLQTAPRTPAEGARLAPPHSRRRASTPAGPRQLDRRSLRRHPALGISPRRRARQAARRASRDATHPARRRTG